MLAMQTTITLDNKIITLIGTAHVSKASADEVLETLENGAFDTIAIELDDDRYTALTENKRWETTDIVRIIKEKKTGLLMAQLILSAYQKRLALQTEVQVGQEMITAIEVAHRKGIRLAKIDRSVTLTFQRIWRSLNFWDKVGMLNQLITAAFENESFSETDIEALKQQDLLEASMAEVTRRFPKIATTLIDERDRIMAYKLRHAKGQQIVAVVGAAHVNGISRYLSDPDLQINELMTLPKPGWGSKAMAWLIPLSIGGLILATIAINPQTALSTIWRFIAINGSLAALGTLIALGHPLSILTAFVAAPIGILSPVLATGWFAGLTEAWIHKPAVKDFLALQEEAMHLKGWWRNRVLRILLVVMLANLFASIGSLITASDLLSNLFN
jgi:pheromone shutdown-related protein TraB